jgi:hypothetical protein
MINTNMVDYVIMLIVGYWKDIILKYFQLK